jgi:molecular chaperone GrpE
LGKIKEPKETAVEVEEEVVNPEPEEAETEATEEQAEQTVKSEPDSYTLTAEEFAAAKAHIEALQKEKDETVQLLKRIQADFDNFRRRNTSVRLESYEEGKRDTIKELLPALDSFDRAIENAGESEKGYLEGLMLVRKQIIDALAKLGLEEVEACGQFDPNLHDAVLREKDENAESGHVLQVMQKGYRVGDRIIRHCMVKVAE